VVAGFYSAGRTSACCCPQFIGLDNQEENFTRRNVIEQINSSTFLLIRRIDVKFFFFKHLNL
jgi:hypothetical protein